MSPLPQPDTHKNYRANRANRANDTEQDSRVRYRAKICGILRDENSFQPKNRMMPNANGVHALHTLYQSDPMHPKLNQMDRSSWFEFISNEDVFKSLYFGLENGGKQRLGSVRMRVKLFVAMIQKNSITNLVILDGHGRFLFALLEALFKTKEPSLMNIEITVVERDQSVHEWHQLFFPRDVRCVRGDIYSHQSIPRQETLTYFNFCGIGGASGLEQFLTQLHSSCLLSFSTRGFRGERSLERFFPSHLRRGFHFEQATEETKFMTIRITSPTLLESPSPPLPLPSSLAPRPPPSSPSNHVLSLPSPGSSGDPASPRTLAKVMTLKTLKELKAFIIENNLKVSWATGGKASRTLIDIRRDISAALSESM